MPEIIPGLWQEPLPDQYDWEKFDLIVSMNGETRGRPPAPGKTLVVLNEDDEDEVPNLQSLAKMLMLSLREDKNVLVHCRQGWNRSGLLVGLVLYELGYSGKSALWKIRQVIPDALCNKTFEKYLRSL